MRTALAFTLASLSSAALLACGRQESLRTEDLSEAPDADVADAAAPDASAEVEQPDVPRSPVECAVSPCVTALSAAANAMCAVMADTSVRCWGLNASGLLGRNDLALAWSADPAPVTGLTGVVQMTGFGGNFCATLSNGTVVCWGLNQDGELGQMTLENGVIVPSAVPLVVPGVANAIGVFVGDHYACATLAEGDAICWGDSNSGRMPGVTPNTANRFVPPSRIALDGRKVKSMALGELAVVALADDGTLFSWGRASRTIDSQVTTLGRESSLSYGPPAPIPTLPRASDIATGRGYDTCAASKGHMYCWGLTSINSAIIPTFINLGTHAKVQTVWNLCATFDDGKARCIGDQLSNQRGELGNGTLEAAPMIATDVLLQGHAIGITRTCALLKTGAVMCWGPNDVGQLGDGTHDINPHPTPSFVRFEP